MIFDVLEESIGKIIESRYIGICPITDKIIDIGRRLPKIIGDLRALSAKLSISKMTGELSKICCYRKNYLSYTPTKGAKMLTNTNLSGQSVIFDILAASASGKYSLLEVWGPFALRALISSWRPFGHLDFVLRALEKDLKN